jgi:hypothetical protein
MQHLDEGTIHAWLDGALDADEAARVEQHAAECATCAAAVAEARGLVAGASRILGALDHVPGGVVPRATGGSLGSARSSRSMWRVLHFTPARAAAAAILIVAAGTMLVVRHAPNGAPALDSESGPDALQPRRGVPAAAPAPTLPEPMVARAPGKRPEAASRREPAREKFGSTASPRPAAAPAPEQARVATTDSVAEKKSVLAAASPMASSAVTSGARAEPAPAATPSRAKMAAVVGGVAGEARNADVAQLATITATSARAGWVGCYSVAADPAAALPSRLALDTTRAVSTDAAAAVASYLVRVLRLGNAGAQATNFIWQPTQTGGVRLYMPASTTSPIELHAVSPELLTGTKTIDNRQVQITLRRLPDCSEQ